MSGPIELALLPANNCTVNSRTLYWMFSRSQLEFVFKELEVFPQSGGTWAAQYGDVMVPVIRLEHHFGFTDEQESAGERFLVLRGVDGQGELHRIIVRTSASPRMIRLQHGLASEQVQLPRNSQHLLGGFTLDRDRLGVLPDVIAVGRNVAHDGVSGTGVR